jgi:transglutaminase/protease-like cytokinesis protein 3
MDAYALSTPQSAVTSLSTLSTYFTASSTKDIEKARAIFRWITENVSYDVQGFLTKNYGDQSPDTVLKRRSAVCEGYARLFEALGKAAGLKVMVISGWAKGFSFNLGDLSGDTNHAWNAISIDGAWYIVESTWGAGSINESKQFAKKFDDYYFLPAPEQLIYTHFPKDQQWQLLSKPLSKTEFAELPEANRGFFKYGLQFVSHRTASITATKELAVTLSAPSDIALTASLEWQGPDIPDTYTFAQKEDSYYVVRAIFPEAASYRLVIYAKKQSDPGMYEGVLKYQVSASEVAGDKAGYPIVYGTFSEKAARLYTPMTYYLRSGLYHSFRIAVPGAEKVAVVMGQSFYHLTGQGGVWTADVMAKQGAIEVCAQYPGNVSYNCLLRYEGW